MRSVIIGVGLGLLLSAMVCEAAGGGAKVRLRERAGVSGDTIRLSDLLPEDAPARLRDAASDVALARSPQLGSIRVLQCEEIAAALASWPGLMEEISFPGRIAVERQGWPISGSAIQKEVAGVLRQRGIDSPGQFQLLIPLVSSVVRNPDLRVSNIAWDNHEKNFVFALRCADRAVCGAFIVRSANFPVEWRKHLCETLRESADGKILAKAGRPATLILESGGIRVSLQVLCLERGSLGQIIRVRDERSRHIYRAEVTGEARLHGSL